VFLIETHCTLKGVETRLIGWTQKSNDPISNLHIVELRFKLKAPLDVRLKSNV